MNQAILFKILRILESEVKTLDLIAEGVHDTPEDRSYASANSAGIKYAIKIIRKESLKQ